MRVSEARQKVAAFFSRYPDVFFAATASLGLVALCNTQFWHSLARVMPLSGAGHLGFAVALFLLLWWLHGALLLLVPTRLAMKCAAAALLITAAACAYFVDSFGIYIDLDTARNMAQTETAEALGLLSPKLGVYLLVLGVLPAWLLTRVRLPAVSLRRHFGQRSAFVLGGALVVVSAMAPHSAQLASFVREHRPLRSLINPGNLIYAGARYLSEEGASAAPQLVDVDGHISRTQTAREGKPILMLLVVGETARAANFQLMGYGRSTTPQLAAMDDLYHFDRVSSCGTATAVSLPCMFSGLGRKDFSVTKAARRTNLLDALSKAGVAVEWRDNNTGCKGICARVPATDMKTARTEALCAEDYCFDEILLTGLPESLAAAGGDQVRVLHQIGSHGPAYWRRYPSEFERFKPTCRSSDLSACSRDEVRNAYDNSILYTDHVLSRLVALLRNLSSRYDTVLLYVSDHGESLGENGLYLHGMPYSLAPAVQTHVPMLLWMSESYRERFAIEPRCVRAQQNQQLSHNHVYHTALGLMGVANAVYDTKRDFVAACRLSQGE